MHGVTAGRPKDGQDALRRGADARGRFASGGGIAEAERKVEQDPVASGRLSRERRFASGEPTGGTEKAEGSLSAGALVPSFVALAYARAHPRLENENLDVGRVSLSSVFSAPPPGPPAAKRPACEHPPADEVGRRPYAVCVEFHSLTAHSRAAPGMGRPMK
jgi:hypothetical protein